MDGLDEEFDVRVAPGPAERDVVREVDERVVGGHAAVLGALDGGADVGLLPRSPPIPTPMMVLTPSCCMRFQLTSWLPPPPPRPALPGPAPGAGGVNWMARRRRRCSSRAWRVRPFDHRPLLGSCRGQSDRRRESRRRRGLHCTPARDSETHEMVLPGVALAVSSLKNDNRVRARRARAPVRGASGRACVERGWSPERAPGRKSTRRNARRPCRIRRAAPSRTCAGRCTS